MAVIVQKYGGTSVGSLERIEAVAENIIATHRLGHQVVVVLSAMAGETNRLLAMAKTLDKQPSTRELDMLLATGEQVSISLLAIALIQRGFSAISLVAAQVGIITDNRFGRARIRAVNTRRLMQALEQEQIVIVAGFQGQDREQNITTLGRGGSDTSAVAIAAALKANECQIFTDVDGIYSADPRIEPCAHKLDQITFEEMLVMASLGAKVLQNRAVEYAMKHQLPIRVLSSFEQNAGTLVTNFSVSSDESSLLKPVSAITHHQDEALISLADLDSADVISEIFQKLGEAEIEIDMICQSVQINRLKALNFTIHRNDYTQTCDIIKLILKKCPLGAIQASDKVVKISAVGVGMKSHAGVAGLFFAALAKENINIQLVSTSEINISVIIDEAHLVESVRTLHNAFQLNSISNK